MKSKKIFKIIFAVLLLTAPLGLFYCGGGGGGGSDGGLGITSVPVISSGEVEALGSVVVNGVRFNTDTAVAEDELLNINNLKKGMIVKVSGNKGGAAGAATAVSFDDNVEGPVTQIVDPHNGLTKILTVMGQKVIVENGMTNFGGAMNFDNMTLTAGMTVEVSGLARPDGSILATFIQETASELEVTGKVSATGFLPPNSFAINDPPNMIVNFAGVTPRNGSMAIGAIVEVHGSAFDVATNTLTAIDVEIKQGLGAVAAEVEVEGMISNLTGSTFTIGLQAVDFSAAKFIAGIEADLANGVRVEAEGTMDAGGVLHAVKVKFRDSIRIEADVETITVDDVAGTGTGTYSGLPGITVMFEDNITELNALADLSGIVPGNNVKVRGHAGSGNTVIATRLDLQDVGPSGEILIQGTVTGFNQGTGVVTIMNTVEVDTTTITDVNFEDENNVIGRAAFFSRLAVGDIVKARNRNNAWDKIEFEED
ncbi:MAG: hypothetical protein C4526_07830 [Nitrospiraceae bacterium]|nr:MAG: hypothetical protein C4526_07830 [Nitrospiraceae bacterium]